MNKYIVIGLKALLSVIGLYLIATWSRWFFQADVMLERLNVSHTSVFGLNMLKSDMGGFVLTIGVLTLMAVWKGGTWWAAALIANAAITVTRIMSGVQDGFNSQVNFAIGLEGFISVIILILLFNDRAYRTQLKQKGPSNG